MSVDPRCASVRVDSEAQLDEIARKLHGKRFRQLGDEESSRVWDVLTAAQLAGEPRAAVPAQL